MLCGVLIYVHGPDPQRKTPALLTYKELERLNTNFFNRLGGQKSILFTRPPDALFEEIMKSCRDLRMASDVLAFRINALLALPKLSSAKLAQNAIKGNFFRREDKYGIRAGPTRELEGGKKMRARASDDISTTEGVRSKLRSRSTETLLIYHLLSRFFSHLICMNPTFGGFWKSAERQVSQMEVILMFHSLMKQLLLHKMRSPNDRFVRELRDIAVPVKSGRWVIKGFTPEELERVFDLYDASNKRKLTDSEKDVARSALKGGVTC